MIRYRCRACGLIYPQLQPTGQPTVHACALVPPDHPDAAERSVSSDPDARVKRKGHRDERTHEHHTGSVDYPGSPPTVAMVAEGLGRDVVPDD